MLDRIPIKTILLFFCTSWFLGTCSMSLAQDRAVDTDLYGTGRSNNTIAEPPSTSSDKSTDLYGTGRGENTSSESQPLSQDKNTDLYGVGRGDNRSFTAPPVSPGKDADTYGGTGRTEQEFPAADKAGTRDTGSDLYSREISAEDVILVINRSPNIQGLTGLMVTNSAFTRLAGTLAIGGSVIFEDSNKPDYLIIQTPITLTFGITDTIEAGLKMKYVYFDRTTPSTSESGLGDSEIALKWRWKTHSTTTPELAIGMAGILPTGSGSKGLNDVTNWGVKCMFMATSETKILGDSFLGLYLEAQAVFIDTLSKANKKIQDRYGVINAGVLLPIGANNRLQAMLELNKTLEKKRWQTALAEGDQTGITQALRYVTDTLSFTAGAQFLSKDTKGYKDTIRWIGTFSHQF
jgi:hypothetical protein